MKKKIEIIVVFLVTLSFIILGFIKGINLDQNQIETLKILLIICGISALYCFIVGEIARNNSQMDKLWSVLPIVYTWIIAIRGGMQLRLVIIAIIVTLWGIRLTFNFARKGAYSIKFWTGVEDYRWQILRKKKFLKSKVTWALFDFGFISVYQNFLVLAMCLPALACMTSNTPFGIFDIIATFLALLFLVIEAIADEEQWVFQSTKYKLLEEGKKLEELDSPFNKGFNTTGLWSRSRHPNYLGEQGIWLSIYIFVIGTEFVHFGIFNWSVFGSMLILLIFLGSSTLGEKISSSKYPEYQLYQQRVSKYIPLRKYQ